METFSWLHEVPVFEGANVTLGITVEPYVLRLISDFGTSHSVTTERSNALIRMTVGSGEHAFSVQVLSEG